MTSRPLSRLALAGLAAAALASTACSKSPTPAEAPAPERSSVTPAQVCDRMLVMMQSELSAEGAALPEADLDRFRGECIADATNEQTYAPESYALSSKCVMESMTLAQVLTCTGAEEGAPQPKGGGGAVSAGRDKQADCEALGRKFYEFFLIEAKQEPEFADYPEEILREGAAAGMQEVIDQCMIADLDPASVECALAARNMAEMEEC
ncbi:hypothetical protein PPSIR1_41824 [Plesiocystis pacifica SIR-1]|uniref:Uncharacterized protein n=1 Tax=Plesiocystis pacifica SIR-1 TaxID=391625 RepID=A6G0V6_9BACT|nr:hypothetical protein [Plesiocystis pacifica]EDM80494.1 hypothetical protein PPSIR1_41824 [Plesiocystis pacifica SIR-1]